MGEEGASSRSHRSEGTERRSARGGIRYYVNYDSLNLWDGCVGRFVCVTDTLVRRFWGWSWLYTPRSKGSRSDAKLTPPIAQSPIVQFPLHLVLAQILVV